MLPREGETVAAVLELFGSPPCVAARGALDGEVDPYFLCLISISTKEFVSTATTMCMWLFV